jgi:NAD(P)-dependent dehydrogenase (short-subunit alcohol dehydrogenase family)
MRAYSQSKLALVMFSFDLARELAGSGVTVNALHPASLMNTKMVREWFGTPRSTVEEGARAVERLVLTEELAGVTGEYFEGQRQARAAAQAYDEEARRRLRQMSERWVGL